LESRLIAKGITVQIFDTTAKGFHQSGICQVVLVNYANASSKIFIAFLKSLPFISRIIFDEAHCINDFNSFMRYNGDIINIQSVVPSAQLVFLSATLSESKRKILFESFQLSGDCYPRVFVLIDERKNLVYNLDVSVDPFNTMLKEIESINFTESLERGMLFFRTKQECDDAGHLIAQTTTYFGEGLVLNKNDLHSPKNMKAWKEGTYKWIACTCGASLGIDYQFVKYVFLVDQFNITKNELDLVVQEFGRGGRSGLNAFCTIFTIDASKLGNSNFMNRWVDYLCLRTQLNGCQPSSPCCLALDLLPDQTCGVCLKAFAMIEQGVTLNPNSLPTNITAIQKTLTLTEIAKEVKYFINVII
jgi:superfamily II DNA helicase RecQ